MKNLADLLYKWLLEDGENYLTYFIGKDPRGLNVCLIIMLGVALGATAIYYFLIANKVNSATKSNYLWTYIFGYVVLCVFTPLLFQFLFKNEGCNVADFWVVFLKIGAMNLFYYTIVYQLLSSFFCTLPWTKAKNITLFKVFFK